MLPKRHRLTREAFVRVNRRGGRLESEHFSLKYLRGERPPAFSAVISKRIARTAVSRHQLKRRIYGALHRYLKESAPEFSGIFFAKRGAGELALAELSRELLALLRRVRP